MNWLEKLALKEAIKKIARGLDKMEKLKGWRTVLYFGVSALLYLMGWEQLTELLKYVTDSPEKVIATATAVLSIVFRVITTGPLGSKQ